MSRLEHSDVVITNLSRRALENLGLTHAALAESRPGLVYVMMPAFGGDDPQRRWWGALDAGIQAACGLSDSTRYPGGPPLRVGGHPIDGATALTAACAALAALYHRAASGRGVALEVPMLNAGLQLMAPLLAPESQPDAAPVFRGVLPAAGDDRWLALTIQTGDAWRCLQETAGLSVAADDPLAGQRLAAWSRGFGADDLEHRLCAAGLDAAAVVRPEELSPPPAGEAAPWSGFTFIPS
jgi:crotonobetainyl-CoA:carnitine CoA-transferase CaiB-like acyl-CoA transferase